MAITCPECGQPFEKLDELQDVRALGLSLVGICPNCGNRTSATERTAGFRNQPKGCSKCGFGFLFEILDDYYPAPDTGFVVTDRMLEMFKAKAPKAPAAKKDEVAQ